VPDQVWTEKPESGTAVINATESPLTSSATRPPASA
jgi:hypothetical protein